MKKCTDKDVLEKSADIRDNEGKKEGGYADFRRQFDKYKRAKGGGEAVGRSVCRPYVETFQKVDRGGKS